MNIIITVFSAWLANQVIKIIIARDISVFFKVGGMPSSHAALAGALATAVAVETGFTSVAAAIAYVILCFTIHHAVHVRKHHTLGETFIGAGIGIIGVILLHYW